MPRKATKQNADVVARIDAQIQGVITEINGQIAQLEEKKSALLRLFGAGTAARRGRPPAGAAPAMKRKVSAATRRKLKEAKKAYWARVRAEKAQAAKAQKAQKAKSEKAAS
jgi:hypothetical protein